MNKAKNPYLVALSALTLAFFMWGALTSLNDILIPHLKSLFQLDYFRAMLVQLCFFAAYGLMSIPMAKLLSRVGYKAGLIIGFSIAAVGCLLFLPAADWQIYGMFLFALFVLATGIVMLQVAANPYVTLLGNPATASRRLTLTQAFNSLGTTVAPILGASLILSVHVKDKSQLAHLDHAQLQAYYTTLSHAIHVPYIILAVVLLAMGLLMAFVALPKVRKVIQAAQQPQRNEIPAKSIWQYRHLVLGAVAIFLYVGAEVSIGSFLVNYFEQPYIAGLSAETAGHYVAYYWGAAMVGRFIGAYFLGKIQPAKLVVFNTCAAVILVLISILTTGKIAMWTILAVGLFNSIMFPTLFSLAIRGLGPLTPKGSGILCTAIVGGAIVPMIQGYLADIIGIQTAFLIPILCYGYIFVYSIWGYNKNFQGESTTMLSH